MNQVTFPKFSNSEKASDFLAQLDSTENGPFGDGLIDNFLNVLDKHPDFSCSTSTSEDKDVDTIDELVEAQKGGIEACYQAITTDRRVFSFGTFFDNGEMSVNFLAVAKSEESLLEKLTLAWTLVEAEGGADLENLPQEFLASV